jgi:hypothetical protein
VVCTAENVVPVAILGGLFMLSKAGLDFAKPAADEILIIRKGDL